MVRRNNVENDNVTRSSTYMAEEVADESANPEERARLASPTVGWNVVEHLRPSFSVIDFGAGDLLVLPPTMSEGR